MIRAVLFDVDDTLCDDTGHFQNAARRIGEWVNAAHPHVDAGFVAETYRAVSDHFWTHEIALVTPEPLARVRERLWRRAFAKLEIEPDPRLLDDVLVEYARLRLQELPALHVGAHETLDRLRAEGVGVGVVTNGLSETHVPKLERLGIARRVDVCLMPDRIGCAKPDPRPFHLACEALGVLPEATAHVGDSLNSDVRGAQGAGLRGIWFNPSRKAHPGECHALPDAVVHSLPELLEWVLAFNAPR